MRKRGARFKRRIDPHAGLHAIAMHHRIDNTQQVDLTIGVRAAALAMRSGAGTEDHVHTLASAINTALLLCERGTGSEHTAAVIDAQFALVRTIERGKRSGKWGFDGPALAQVEAGIEVFEAQLASITRIEARDAVREVTRRVNQGHVFEVAA